VDIATARRGYSDGSFLLHRILHQKVRNVENLRGKIHAFVLVKGFDCGSLDSGLVERKAGHDSIAGANLSAHGPIRGGFTTPGPLNFISCVAATTSRKGLEPDVASKEPPKRRTGGIETPNFPSPSH